MIFSVRQSVTKALEQKRTEKFIGASLEAKVTLHTGDKELYDRLCEAKDDLAPAFIVSAVDVQNDDKGAVSCEGTGYEGVLTFTVEKAPGSKCERCWCYSEYVGTNGVYPTLCERCARQAEQVKLS